MGKSYIYILIGILSTLLGCHNIAPEIGGGLITGQDFDVSFVDTLTLKASTVKFDSLVSSNIGRLIVGYHNDEKLGPVNVKTVLQISPPSSLVLDPISTHYIGLTLTLYRDKYFYYDTTKQMTFHVYRVTNEQQLFNGALYNVDNFKIDNTPLGSITIDPRPNLTDSVEVPLSDDLGRQWMQWAQSGDPNITPTNFAALFYGLALIPDSTQSGCVLGFTTKGSVLKDGKKQYAPMVRMYYQDDTTLPGSYPIRHADFIIGASQFHWSKFTGDRSATKLAPLKVGTDILSSTLTDHEIYLQGGTGVAMRIEMPFLKGLNAIQPFFQCTRAVLTLKPIGNLNDPMMPYPTSVNVDLVNSLNVTLSSAYLGSVLTLDQLGNASYTFDVTSFVNGEINATDTNIGNGLLVRLLNTDVNSTVNRLYVGDQKNYFGMKLKVYYLTLTDSQ